MKIRFAVAAGVAAVAALVGLGVSTASATATTSSPVGSCHTDWYVNPDEGGADAKQGDRRPIQVPAGLEFKGNDLIHHATSLPIANLKPGSFLATPAPSLGSFFSVEVWNDGGSGYATLRWDAALSKWNIGGTSFYDADPAKLVADHNKGTTVRTFGVGYVNSPNNGAKTVVTSVTFAGKVYVLGCLPKPHRTYTPKPPVTSTVTTTNNPAPTTIKVPVTVPVKVTVNPGQFAVTPNTSKGIDTGDGSLS
jgi:hypothetical protein